MRELQERVHAAPAKIVPATRQALEYLASQVVEAYDVDIVEILLDARNLKNAWVYLGLHGIPLGCIALQFPTWLGKRIPEISLLLVVKEARGQGIGKALVNRVAKKHPVLQVDPRPRAIPFYRSVGFRFNDRRCMWIKWNKKAF